MYYLNYIDIFDSYVDGRHIIIMEQIQNCPLLSIFCIILNHWPLLTCLVRFVKPLINELELNLILKVDNHHVCNFIQEFIKEKRILFKI
ncbi:unnamed protein product [Rotaria sp. Silwood2]|nr:unnamed protein product [Rotaria sp. Silwood2]CAF4306488.1 unnamed protein product [Rotaria sp. Silwood2]